MANKKQNEKKDGKSKGSAFDSMESYSDLKKFAESLNLDTSHFDTAAGEDDFLMDSLFGNFLSRKTEFMNTVWKQPVMQSNQEMLRLIQLHEANAVNDVEEEMFAHLRNESYEISTMLAEAMGKSTWLEKMNEAAFVRKKADDMLHFLFSMDKSFNGSKLYITELKTELVQFQKHFRDWVRTFDALPKEEEDGWGLFIRR